MIIHELRSENVKRIKAVAYKPDGSLIVIGGENGNGKSSFIDSIKYALGGKKTHPPRPVREGTSKAEIYIDMGDYIIECTITPSGRHVVKVFNADGVEQHSPQALLDKMFGDLSFDPLEFSRMDKWKRLETLKKLVGLDFTELDTKRGDIYIKRTNANRNLKELKAQFDEMPEYPDIGTEPQPINNLAQQLQEIEDHNKKYRAILLAAQKKEDQVKASIDKVCQLNDKIKFLQDEREKQLLEQVDFQREADRFKDDAEKFGERETTEVMKSFRETQEVNEKITANVLAAAKKEEIKSAEKVTMKMTENIKEIDSCKNNSMEKAEFPILGLSFSSEGVLYQGVPFEQCAASEQLRISVAMGLAMNPELRVLLIRDGSLLDTANLGLVAKMAAEADPPAQVWMERVGKGKECSVIIEDGMVKDDLPE